MSTPENPWATEAGRRARQVELRLLAKEDGVLGEFARETLAGRTELRALLYSSVLQERDFAGLRGLADQWHSLPETEQRALIATSEENTQRRIDALNAIPEERPEPPPVPRRRRPVVDEDEDEPPQDWFDGKLRGR